MFLATILNFNEPTTLLPLTRHLVKHRTEGRKRLGMRFVCADAEGETAQTRGRLKILYCPITVAVSVLIGVSRGWGCGSQGLSLFFNLSVSFLGWCGRVAWFVFYF